jgi:hypothetical protein
MACEFGEAACAALQALEPIKLQISDFLTAAIGWFWIFWDKISHHLHAIAGLFGAAMAALRWWDRRETVIFGRLNNLLADQGQKIRNSSAHTLGAMNRPTLGKRPTAPLFSAKALQRIFRRNRWQPAYSLAGPHRVDRQLNATHDLLVKKENLAAEQRAFLVEQRFAAYVIEGALAAARSARSDTSSAKALGERALEKFDAALKVEGKAKDLVTLELRALQLFKLGRAAEANQEFERIEELTKQHLDDAALSTASRNSHLIRFVRVARYQAASDHADGSNVNARNNHLKPTLQDERLKELFSRQLERHELFERAQFYEVYGCVAAQINGMPEGGQAVEMFSKARSDYTSLADQLDPKRSGGLFTRREVKNNLRELRKEAEAGLKRIAQIEASPKPGTPVCPH